VVNAIHRTQAASSPAGGGGVEPRNGERERARAWRILENVPDPEIPALSVVDLGIVRNVGGNGDSLIVTITPTYSGCPAAAVIAMDIREALARAGYDVEIKTQLAPPWTTRWIRKAGREKLKAFGIAPPVEGQCAGAAKMPTVVECPHCSSTRTERISQFGSTPCKAQWRCKDCLEPFDYFKSL